MRVYERGAHGDTVIRIQKRLQALGFYEGVLDGAYGPKTDAAVRAFQRARDLTDDGIVGGRTWDYLFSSTTEEPLSYRRPGLVLKRRGSTASKSHVRDLQRDLRSLGYLRQGIDGAFGPGTELAVKALQHDLLFNAGASTTHDGEAPVRVVDYNRGRVVDVDGHVDEALAACITDILADPRFPRLPRAEDPREENRKIKAQIAAMSSREAPIPFLIAIMMQESRLKHFNEPGPGDDDTYIRVGLDTNASRKHVVTSRGYGVGQYTLFHHPPQPQEVRDVMLDVGGNMQKAIGELRDKFDHFLNGPTTGTRADDRMAEYGNGPLRTCKFSPTDPRYMTDCRTCLKEAGSQRIESGKTPLYKGSSHTFQPTQYYRKASYRDVPVRHQIGCDWPYAVRRYNGAGMNSYHYQVRVLKHLQSLKGASSS